MWSWIIRKSILITGDILIAVVNFAILIIAGIIYSKSFIERKEKSANPWWKDGIN